MRSWLSMPMCVTARTGLPGFASNLALALS